MLITTAVDHNSYSAQYIDADHDSKKMLTSSENYLTQDPELGTRSFFLGSLSAQFLSMDGYRSITHFANFQVRSSLNHSKKNQWFALGKER